MPPPALAPRSTADRPASSLPTRGDDRTDQGATESLRRDEPPLGAARALSETPWRGAATLGRSRPDRVLPAFPGPTVNTRSAGPDG
ncbi:MAG: hypothetical protein AVDCRST_MAG49-1144 [uncultured Thermomicrobiales bacterium]|uniref:Uncharacterized protein n=1 Tax=uncultured Thermomicrobiales bacterium TaxID=1645740 RepID=A0A6J4UAA8_9BACT|nr:MAG: hypothetical protein AVDCRST_MAG49-1144 [uncultured Thermomicrobiales bacterium]